MAVSPSTSDDGEFFDDEPDVSAPTVVAVVVASDPGPWFEETLTSLTGQDYPHLSVLVIDVGAADITPRVAAAAPNAFVRRLGPGMGFAAAANEVLAVVEGASHFVFCHDDVAPDPDAVRLLLEESFRSNAAVVGPKLVQWDDPTRLLQVGLSADKVGVTIGPVERGELDQEQHDAVRDVFAVPGGLTLVRADLFTTIGGFDPAMSPLGEDLDLCWRAQIAGGRVLVAPAARVRHVEAMTRAKRPGQEGGRTPLRPLEVSHRLRTVLKNYSRFHLLRVVPQLVILNLAEAIYTFAVGRRPAARAIVGAWRTNLRGLGELRAERRRVRAYRAWPDSEVRRLQTRGYARLTRFLRGQLGRNDRARLLGDRDWSGSWRNVRVQVAVWTAIAVVLVVGSRSLLSGAIPAVGEFAPFRGSATLARLFFSDWRTSGLGSAAPAPPAFGLLWIGGTVLLGGMGLLQKILILGALPVGLIGAYRLARPLDSIPARVVALVVYASIPLPYDALARGRWGGLIAYAVAPWVLRSLAIATRTPPYAALAPDDSTEPTGRRWGSIIGLGVLFAVTGALAPAVIVSLLVAAVGLALGGLVADGGGARALGLALAATGVAIVLLAPWSIDLLIPGGGAARLTGVAVAPARAPDLVDLLRFHTGPLGGGPIGWAFIVIAALPLLVGHDWRLSWAARCWGVALAGWGFAWAGGRGWLPIPAPAAEVALAPVAVALALAAGLGLVAFRTDVPAYRFGWRQFASTAAGVAMVAGSLPVFAAAIDGRWHLPGRDFRSQLSWMPDHRQEGAFRVLWIGDPEALPMQGWSLGDGVAYGLSDQGVPDVTELWPASDEGATGLVADALRLARREQTTRLGLELAPMAVRYLVVVDRAAPTTKAPRLGALPADVVRGLAGQLDLKLVSRDNDQLVYENAAWGPGRARLGAGREDADLFSARDLAAAAPALRTTSSPLTFRGEARAGDTVFFSEAASSNWKLRVGGRPAVRRRALGFANAFTVTKTGTATLRYSSSPVRILIVLVEVLLWVGALRFLVVRRVRKGRA
ncbi:MAG TPA: glycosyltransferase family 2 protein [Acidimicrobiales bacterium]|nr:glycosyltransferase family 2 protein [Acidimicrobiales bacterium]